MKSTTQMICVMTTIVLSSTLQPALAQQQQNGGSAGAPLFQIPNFEGDARVGDLYEYMHRQQFPQWDEYQRRLHERAQSIEHQQPIRQSPSPENASPNTSAFVNMVNGIASSAGGNNANQQQQQQQSASTGAQTATIAQQQPQVSTSVSGAVLMPGQAGPVPGLVDP